MSNVSILSAQKDEEGVLLVTGSSDINSSVVNDTIVQKNCLLRVRGNLLGNLTIEPGAEVIVEGSVAGKIINRGGRLAVNHKAASVMTDGACCSRSLWRPDDQFDGYCIQLGQAGQAYRC